MLKEKRQKVNLRFAVCTKSGILVDQHFGHATELIIYEYENGNIEKIERRPVRPFCMGPESCDADERMNDIIHSIADCVCVICMRIGNEPAESLLQSGIAVRTACDRIETAVKAAVECGIELQS
jgi:predicted Fe-Mo cluster-binding NifX family protein